MYIQTYADTYVDIHRYIYIYIYIIYIYIDIHTHIPICTEIHTYLRTDIRAYIYT